MRAVTAWIGVCLIGAASLLLIAGPAGAQEGCGEQSVGFPGARLLNDGISDTAGPFSFTLPAGTYDVTMRSHDAHDEHPGQVEQTAEQWYFSLDSGYVSPPAVDVPDDANTSTTVHTAQVIGASTSITVHHRGVGNINSVDVVCVGFTPSAGPTQPEDDADVVVDIAEPAGIVRQPPTADTDAIVDDQIVEVEVAGSVETQAPSSAQPATVAAGQLALSGPTRAMTTLIAVGLGLVLVGASLVTGQRRSLPLRVDRTDSPN